MAFGLPRSEGEPLLSYGSYLQIDQLRALQKLQSDPAQHDELLFIIIHQVFELWFKQLLHELDAIKRRMDEDEPLGAQRLLRRCIEIQRVLIAQIKVLETMTPNDFLTFRDLLMPASGFQSAQFRAIEFVCGVKNERHLADHAAGSEDLEALKRRLKEPTVGESFYGLLRRRGFVLPPDTDGGDGAHERRVRELTRIYQQTDNHYDLYMLAESLVEFDEMFSLWRLHHVAMVERMIGSKPGTGGSEGVTYLRKTLDRKFFPELWELRSYLSARSAP
ncbi:MAG: tryptophan 2,3-dioxygenase [Longimicrobiales bacterium]